MARKNKLSDDEINKLYLDYCANYTYKELSAKHGVSESYIAKLVHKEGWAEKKKQTKALAMENIQTAYIDASEQLVDRYFQAGYRLLCLWEQSMQANAGSLLDKQGKFSQFKLAQSVQNIIAIKAFLDDCTGVMSFKDAMDLKYKYEQMDLKKALSGIGVSDEVQDNFVDILEESFRRLQEEGGMDANK